VIVPEFSSVVFESGYGIESERVPVAGHAVEFVLSLLALGAVPVGPTEASVEFGNGYGVVEPPIVVGRGVPLETPVGRVAFTAENREEAEPKVVPETSEAVCVVMVAGEVPVPI
jgi:hypothetical protein